MMEFATALSALRRPRILVGAARKGLAHYRRERDLPRLVAGAPGNGVPALRLLEKEARLEAIRASGDAGYSVSDHVAVLTALIAEATLVPAVS